MSILDKGNADVLIFREEVTTDDDGNPINRPSVVGTPARAMIQPLGSLTDDQDATGNVSGPTRYRMRLVRRDHAALGLLGRQSAVEWQGERWTLLGDPVIYSGSRRTSHVDYTIGRA